MLYILYEIKNNINGKIYVGVHKTRVEDDGYMGSGTVIKRAIEKHGLENFTKTILERFETQAEMFEREKEFVNEEFIAREDVYNLRRGGFGGFDYLNDGSVEHSLRTSKGGKNAVEVNRKNKRGVFDPERNNSFSKDKESQKLGNSPSSRLKAVETQKKTFAMNDHQKGQKNSQFGSMWITNGIENKKIRKEESVPCGWIRGRK